MKRPFNIFPSIGYKNSQFQVLATKDNIKIEIFHNGIRKKEILTPKASTVIIQKLEKPGVYTAKCNYLGEIFVQEINVQDAFRLGSSKFKKAFVFDDSKYSFFLMKDRLLLYDEIKDILLTENHYSPTEILQINQDNYLFVTELGRKTDGIVNLGIYNTNSFSILGELINDYQTIKISPETNKVWLFKKSSESIHCFELISKLGDVFTEIRKFENAAEYVYDSELTRISINQEEKIIFADANSVSTYFEITKTDKNAIDHQGNNILLDESHLNIINEFNGYNMSFNFSDRLNLHESDFLYLGSDFKSSNTLTDLTNDANKIKEDLINSLPENKTYYSHSLPENEVIQETLIKHQIFPTIHGIFIVKNETVRKFIGVNLRKREGEWSATPRTSEKNVFSVITADSLKSQIQIEPTTSFRIVAYYGYCLVVKAKNRAYVLNGNSINQFAKQCSFNFYSANNYDYLFVEENDLYSVYEISNIERPILKQVNILNSELIEHNKVVWYKGEEKFISESKYLNAFDLSSKFSIQLDEKRAQQSLFKDASNYKFNEGFILSSNNIIINPKTAIIKDSFLGTIESHSSDLIKIVSQRTNHIYLSIFNTSLKKYEEREIELDINKYRESYFSPNGELLVLQDDSNKYLLYNIEKNETVRFFSGNFLSFSKEGNLIIEKDRTRAIKIYDPLTFIDITPPNYHHYRFLSPDGKLYSQVSLKSRYINKLNGDDLSVLEVSKFRKDLDDPSIFLSIHTQNKKVYEREKEKIDRNRRTFFLNNKSKLNEFDIKDHSRITSHTVVKVEKFTEIGIVGTKSTTEILFPEYLAYYNYAAFSFDNEYFAYVGKPSSKGLIHLFKLDFNESTQKIQVKDSYLSRYPRYASWVCGFSKTGYFATYDSTPDTYLLKVDEQLFESKTDELELRKNIYNSKSNIYHQYNKWNEIKGKNFLCFSPSGEYLALSEQGYEPLTIGGYGHQESNAVHIAITESGKIVDSFTGHGDKIKDNKRKKVTFVAFSEDDKRIMTLSSDGVVVVRNIKIKESIKHKQKEEILATMVYKHNSG